MINAQGLMGNEDDTELPGRGKRDGCVLVGSSQEGELYNDIILPEDDENSGIGKRHFILKYNIETKSYYLRDLGDGNGTFVRLDTPLLLKNGFIISFGDSHMVV